MMDALVLPAVLAAVTAAFALSAAAGMGGSLVLVPTLAVALGPKQGLALAALLLAGNNVVKMVAYRATLPWRAAGVVVACTVVGAAVGARLLVSAPQALVGAAVIVSCAVGLVAERWQATRLRVAGAPVLALGAGATSGFSGTSGPLKGVALRILGLDRRHLVGAASLASLAGDVSKTAVYAGAGLLDTSSALLAAAVPLMVAATVAGRRINDALGERRYAALFWAVIAGYAVRLLGTL